MVVLFLLVVVIVLVLGFVVSALLWVAAALFILWALGWIVRPGGRWYAW